MFVRPYDRPTLWSSNLMIVWPYDCPILSRYMKPYDRLTLWSSDLMIVWPYVRLNLWFDLMFVRWNWRTYDLTLCLSGKPYDRPCWWSSCWWLSANPVGRQLRMWEGSLWSTAHAIMSAWNWPYCEGYQVLGCLPPTWKLRRRGMDGKLCLSCAHTSWMWALFSNILTSSAPPPFIFWNEPLHQMNIWCQHTRCVRGWVSIAHCMVHRSQPLSKVVLRR